MQHLFQWPISTIATAARCRRWARQLTSFPFIEMFSPTSAPNYWSLLPDEAIAQFAPYPETACPLSSTPASAAGAEDEIMSLLYTHVDPIILSVGLSGLSGGATV